MPARVGQGQGDLPAHFAAPGLLVHEGWRAIDGMDGMDAAEALYRDILARGRPVSPTLPTVYFPNRASGKPCGRETVTQNNAPAAAAAAAAAGTGSYGSDADILALLQPRRPAPDAAPDGPFLSAEAFEAHRVCGDVRARLDARAEAISEPARFF